MDFDAVIVPGGGVDAAGRPALWVIPRLEVALAVPGEPPLLLLSSGTVHKPPPLDPDGFPVHESVAGARYLLEQGCSPERILLDTWSLDTVGNAYFARVAHCEPAALYRLLVITSEFHMPRVRQVFEWVFGLPPSNGPFQLEFEAVRDAGPADDLEKRREQEREAIVQRVPIYDRIRTMRELHAHVFTKHAAYLPERPPSEGGPLY